MRLSFGARVALSLVAFVVLAGAGFAWLMSNVGCAALSAHHVPDPDARASPTPTPGEPLALDEARTRAEAPDLAALLDAALGAGRATLDDEDIARAADAYLRERRAESAARGDLVSWRGEAFEMRMAIC